MASPGLPPEESTESAEEQSVWHPAQEWPDEADDTTEPDYQPSQSRSEDDEWEDEMSEDEETTFGASGGHQNAIGQGNTQDNPQVDIGSIRIEFGEDDGDEDIDVDGDDTIVIGESNDPRSTYTDAFSLFVRESHCLEYLLTSRIQLPHRSSSSFWQPPVYGRSSVPMAGHPGPNQMNWSMMTLMMRYSST
jgi:hypothetical protein